MVFLQRAYYIVRIKNLSFFCLDDELFEVGSSREFMW